MMRMRDESNLETREGGVWLREFEAGLLTQTVTGIPAAERSVIDRPVCRGPVSRIRRNTDSFETGGHAIDLGM